MSQKRARKWISDDGSARCDVSYQETSILKSSASPASFLLFSVSSTTILSIARFSARFPKKPWGHCVSVTKTILSRMLDVVRSWTHIRGYQERTRAHNSRSHCCVTVVVSNIRFSVDETNQSVKSVTRAISVSSTVQHITTLFLKKCFPPFSLLQLYRTTFLHTCTHSHRHPL